MNEDTFVFVAEFFLFSYSSRFYFSISFILQCCLRLSILRYRHLRQPQPVSEGLAYCILRVPPEMIVRGTLQRLAVCDCVCTLKTALRGSSQAGESPQLSNVFNSILRSCRSALSLVP